MMCLTCKKEKMQKTTTAYFAQLNERYIIIENVPCFKCEECGEVFYATSTLEIIDRIIEKVQKMSGKLSIVEYNQAA